MAEDVRQELLVHGWNSQCGECHYGGTSWVDSPANEGKEPLSPDSKSCPECGAEFTHRVILPGYVNERTELISNG